MSCVAIIKNGPRAGQRCERWCRMGQQYCERYHSKLASQASSAFSTSNIVVSENKAIIIREAHLSLPQPPTILRAEAIIADRREAIIADRREAIIADRREAIIADRREAIIADRREALALRPARREAPTPKEIPVNTGAQKKIMYELLGKNASTLLNCLCCMLQRGNIDHIEYNEDCIICTSQARKDEYWAITPCRHRFHAECLRDWMNTFRGEDKGCPLCRTAIRHKIKKGFVVC